MNRREALEDFNQQREETAGRAKAWTAHQARRLEISEEAIETAIRRGWTPDQIDQVKQAVELLETPGKAKYGS